MPRLRSRPVSESYYTSAAICTRGHVVTSVLEEPAGKHCSECGAPVVTACGACGARIRGVLIVRGVVGLGPDYEPPGFCDNCGAAHPWVGRQQRLYELANLAEHQEGIDEATMLWLRERLAAIQAINAMDTKAQAGAWQEIKDHARPLWDNPIAAEVIGGLLTEAVKRVIR